MAVSETPGERGVANESWSCYEFPNSYKDLRGQKATQMVKYNAAECSSENLWWNCMGKIGSRNADLLQE